MELQPETSERRRLRIAVGLDGEDTPAHVQALCDCGADEFFAGFVPPEWSNRYGWEIGLNRRTFGPQCQYRDPDALADAIATAHARGRPVNIAFNSHSYTADQIPLIRKIVFAVDAMGPDAYIVADPALIALFQEWGLQRPLHLSTGAACYNSETVRYFCTRGRVKRVVFPRKMTIREMHRTRENLADLALEFEAMVAGYRCGFNDEFCFSWHSGGTSNLCAGFDGARTATSPRFPRDWKQRLEAVLGDLPSQFTAGSELDRLLRDIWSQPLPADLPSRSGQAAASHGMSLTLAKAMMVNCGLCSIAELRRAGIDVLKVPVRGAAVHKIFQLSLVRQVADHPNPNPDVCRDLLDSPAFCAQPGSCYYHVYGRGEPE